MGTRFSNLVRPRTARRGYGTSTRIMVIQCRYRDGTGKRLALSCLGWRLPVRANVRRPKLAQTVTAGLHLFPDADSCAGLGRCGVLLKYNIDGDYLNCDSVTGVETELT